jgi:hypothetical protein
MSTRSISCVLLSPKHAAPRDHIAVRIQLAKLHEYLLIKGVSLFYNAKSKESLNKWMKYLNLSESACGDIAVPIVKGDAFIVGSCGSCDLEQLYDDFPNINELIGKFHAGALQRTNGQQVEEKKKRAACTKSKSIQFYSAFVVYDTAFHQLPAKFQSNR